MRRRLEKDKRGLFGEGVRPPWQTFSSAGHGLPQIYLIVWFNNKLVNPHRVFMIHHCDHYFTCAWLIMDTLAKVTYHEMNDRKDSNRPILSPIRISQESANKRSYVTCSWPSRDHSCSRDISFMQLLGEITNQICVDAIKSKTFTNLVTWTRRVVKGGLTGYDTSI